MDRTNKSTASSRQFEVTAVSKLVLEGIPKHVAEAFVKIGLPKSGRLQQIKDQVCKMEYTPFFVPASIKDVQDPLRVGSYVPHVVESRSTKFHCEFQMSDMDAARFSKAFPEFEVISKGRTFNQHAFYANKRYAETELVFDMIVRDSKRSGLRPDSVIDLGGNKGWHDKRGRDFVHCDNPVLSARDVMRYKTRYIFSGSSSVSECNKKFQDCTHEAHYAMGIHSTYDMTPKSIADSMRRKNIKKFFGVINILPDMAYKRPGVYESDGVTTEIVADGRSPAVANFGFKHDPSLLYSHKLGPLTAYLMMNKRYDFVGDKEQLATYVYRIVSVRGNSLIFSISAESPGLTLNESLWSPASRRMYYISLKFMEVDKLEVDAELFDRIVLHAASARNVDEYDITSLFRYAKSLRQRVSINGVVLSSGFSQNPYELVSIVVAAFSTAMAYRVESSAYFKKATRQIVNLRSGGFLKDAYDITTETLKILALAVPAALYKLSRLRNFKEKVDLLVRSGRSVSVELFKPHTLRGASYNKYMLSNKGALGRVTSFSRQGVVATPYSNYYNESLLPVTVSCDGVMVRFMAKGMVSYDQQEMPMPTLNVKERNVSELFGSDSPGSVLLRDSLYGSFLKKLYGFTRFDLQATVLSNGDRLYRPAMVGSEKSRVEGRSDMSFVDNLQNFVVMRGVGSKCVSLKPPAMYSGGKCLGFFLFYDRKSLTKSLDVSAAASGARYEKPTAETVVDSQEDGANKASASTTLDGSNNAEDESWVSPSSDVSVRVFATSEDADNFMTSLKERPGGLEEAPYMSGALPDSAPETPPHSPDLLVTQGTKGLGLDMSADLEHRYDLGFNVAEVRDVQGHHDEKDGDSEDADAERTVASDDVVPGKGAMEELVEVCEESKKVAIGSSKTIIDFATAVARGDSTVSKFYSVAQGHPGNVKLVKVDDEGVFKEFQTGDTLEHMAVSDGLCVYDKLTKPPSPGVYVTSDVMLIYTGSAIRDAVKSVVEDSFSCPVTCVNGVAGSGKSHYILHHATAEDMVLCETRESLKDLASELFSIPGWKGRAYTVDSYLLSRYTTGADVLWIDEAFRLHAGKLYSVMKLVKPRKVCCFGDSKQIPALPFLPGFEFSYNEFPYSRVELKRDSWRCPADVCVAVSGSKFYGFHVTTHNPIMRSFHGPVRFRTGMFDYGRNGPLLVYTKVVRDDLRAQGVKEVITIGQSQGKTYDHVTLFRDNQNHKALYYDKFQTLVALTRHRKTFTYVTVCAVDTDDSDVAGCVRDVRAKGSEIQMASHFCKGVKPASDYAALEARVPGAASLREEDKLSESDDESFSKVKLDWADLAAMEDDF